MLKISEEEGSDDSVTLQLEGRLVAEWVGELRQVCEKFLREGRRVKLNLAQVSFVDQDGVKFLADLRAPQVALVQCTRFVEEQLRAGTGR